MKQLCLPSKKISGKPWLFARRGILFQQMGIQHAKYSVTLSSSRLRLTKLIKRAVLTNGNISKLITWRSGPKGNKYVFISARDVNID